MSNLLPGSGRFVRVGMGVPTTSIGAAPNWRGNSMENYTVVPLLPGGCFDARGVGTFSLKTDFDQSSRISGRQGMIDVLLNTGTYNTPVAAAGSITTVAAASLVDGETFTLNDGSHTATIFEFDSNSSITGGRTAVTITGGMTATQVRDAMVSAINGVAGTLAITAAPGTSAQVLLTNDAVGSAGNTTITETVANAGFLVNNMSGGVSASPERTVLYLTDAPTSPSNYIVVALDATNRPLVRIKNILGTSIAVVTPSGSAVAANTPVKLRLSWNSQTVITGTRFTSLEVNSAAISASDWSTDPVVAWLPFAPTHMVVGQGISPAADFNGTVLAVQLANSTL